MVSTKMRFLGCLVAGALVGAACSDDGDGGESAPAPVEEIEPGDETDTAPVAGDASAPEVDEPEAPAEDALVSSVGEYCAVIEEVGENLPNDDQFDRLLAAAPDEIADSLAVVVDAIRADGEAAFSDPDVVASFPVLDEFEAENCDSADAGGSMETVNPDAERIDVTTTEYAFEYAVPSAGAVSFVVTNPGVEVHEMLLARFVGEATLEDALTAEDPEAEGLVETVGFAGPVAPGGELVLNIDDLTPGRYAIVCLIPAPDGVSHAEKGMVSQFAIG